MSDLIKFRTELRAAYSNGYVHRVSDTYVKLRWWSIRSYFSTMSAWRARLIGSRIRKRIDVTHSRTEARREANNAHNVKRADAFRNAAASIGLVKS